MDNSEETAALRAAKLAELTDWLHRLVGKFRYEGSVAEVIGANGSGRQVEFIYSRANVEGSGDCIAVGEGAGVQCMMNVSWTPPTRRYSPIQGSPLGILGAPSIPGRAQFMTLDPAAMLYGIDPEKMQIRVLQVNSRGIAAAGSGTLKDDMATLTLPCKIPDLAGTCEQLIQITAKPDSRPITIDITVRDSVHREAQTIRYLFVVRRQAEEETQD